MDFYKIIHLFRQFKKYDKYSYAELVDEITPSINLGQYQLFYKDNNLIGFLNWAFITDTVEQRFKTIGKLKKNEWNCGNNIWIINCIATKNFSDIFKWYKDYFKSITEKKQIIKWIRINSINNLIRKTEHRING